MSKGDKPKYHRVLLKLSGEVFLGEQRFGIDSRVISSISSDIAEINELGVEVAIVIGGGLWGLESARGLKDLGLEVTVVEFAPWLLPRQLDEEGAAVLKRAFEDMGIKTVTGAICQAIEGEGRASGVRLKDGRHLAGVLGLPALGVFLWFWLAARLLKVLGTAPTRQPLAAIPWLPPRALPP